ncbi:MAG: hypothetical protein GC160_16455 [Acidobacteria bacterium]|nr:hypothetical protein [Acidobacteriota bacterium]
MIRKVLFAGLCCLLGAAAVAAQPRLELHVPANLTRPLWITTGSNGPTDLFFEAANAGSGSLSVQASGGFYSWLTPQVGAAAACSFDASRTCFRISVLFNTASLEAGEYHGAVEVKAPGAVDAPQSVEVTIYVGGNEPSEVQLYVPPIQGASDFKDFQTPAGPAPVLTAAGSFLQVTSSGLGSFRFVHTHRILGGYNAGLNMGANQGTVFMEGSSFASDNRPIPVTLNVTSSPIIVPNTEQLMLETAEGVAVRDAYLSFSNRGQGNLNVTGAAVSTDAGGDWLSTETLDNNLVAVKTNVDGLAAGLYRGVVRVDSNAANGPTQVEVWLSVQASSAPISSYRGAVNGATFDPTRPMSPGTIVSIFGDQLSYGFEQAQTVPLPTEMGGAQVMVNGVAAPLFFVSFGQINFQIPYGVSAGTALIQVVRDGQTGNQIQAQIDTRSAGIFRFNIGEYGAIQNATQGNFPLPVEIGQQLGIPTAPARPGDVLVIYATGLGPVTPEVPTGAAAPSSPLSYAVDMPIVNFGRLAFGPLADPLFVGLSPTFVGLFQVNVVVPDQSPTDPRTRLTLEYPDGRRSNTVEIAVEQP